MKQCSKCLENKDLSEFRVKSAEKGTLQPWCTPCRKIYDALRWSRQDIKRRKNENRKKVYDRNARYVYDYLLRNPCARCGESDPVVLEFDHRDRNDKISDVSEMIRESTITAIQKEIMKCDVLCANCHRKKTALQFGWRITMF